MNKKLTASDWITAQLDAAFDSANVASLKEEDDDEILKNRFRQIILNMGPPLKLNSKC